MLHVVCCFGETILMRCFATPKQLNCKGNEKRKPNPWDDDDVQYIDEHKNLFAGYLQWNNYLGSITKCRKISSLLQQLSGPCNIRNSQVAQKKKKIRKEKALFDIKWGQIDDHYLWKELHWRRWWVEKRPIESQVDERRPFPFLQALNAKQVQLPHVILLLDPKPSGPLLCNFISWTAVVWGHSPHFTKVKKVRKQPVWTQMEVPNPHSPLYFHIAALKN